MCFFWARINELIIDINSLSFIAYLYLRASFSHFSKKSSLPLNEKANASRIWARSYASNPASSADFFCASRLSTRVKMWISAFSNTSSRSSSLVTWGPYWYLWRMSPMICKSSILVKKTFRDSSFSIMRQYWVSTCRVTMESMRLAMYRGSYSMSATLNTYLKQCSLSESQ